VQVIDIHFQMIYNTSTECRWPK